MGKKIISLLWMICTLAILSCASSDPTFFISATGWTIGWSVDEITGLSHPKILKTSDGGISWKLQAVPGEGAGLQGNDISAVNENVAWAALGDPDSESIEGGILKTTDGGITWMFQELPGGMKSGHMKCIKGLTPEEAWAVSLEGDVLHTTDGGVTWRLVPVRTASGENISFTLVNRMDAVGHDIWIADVLAGASGVVHSRDGGRTWRRENMPDMETQSSGPIVISAINSLMAWTAANQDGHLWWTFDGGHSWNKSNDSLTATADFDDICASDYNVVWIACNGGGRNGGFTARVRVTNGNYESNMTHHYPYMMEGVSPLTDDIAWAVGQRMDSVEPEMPMSGIFFTRDGGVNWEARTLPDNAADVILWKVSFAGARR
jgi:photosystem II stability/assembly factor-like uncharacterized protein